MIKGYPRLLVFVLVTIVLLWGLDRLLFGLTSNGTLGLYQYRVFILIPLLYITLAVSLNLINGITGQFSLGHAGFFAIGAYLSAGFSKFYAVPWLAGMPPSMQGIMHVIFLLIALLIGGIAAALAGLLIGAPTLRLKGDYLAIATLGFGEIIRIMFENANTFGGPRGFTDLPQWTGFGFFWYALVAVGCIAVCRNLLQSAHGLAFLSVREDEVAAESMGINTTRYKVMAFILGAAFAGIAGSLLSHYEGSIYPNGFNLDVSIMIVAMVVLGGQGSITGAVLAGAGLKMLEEALRFLPEFSLFGRTFQPLDLRYLVFALVLILTMIFRQQGLLGHREFGWKTIGIGKRSKVEANG